MAASLVSIDINELEKQRLGYLGISLTAWTVNTVSQYASGSKWECAGSVYELTGNEDMGTAGEWAGIANSTLVYSYFNPASLDFHWITTAPTWDTAKQGWYGTGGSATYRYCASVYKDSGGNYTQKTILIDREKGVMYQGVNIGSNAANADHYIRVATDASILWDESEDKFTLDKGLIITGTITATQRGLGNSYALQSPTENNVFDQLDTYIPNTNDKIFINGGARAQATSDFMVFSHAERTGASTIKLYYARDTTFPRFGSTVMNNGSATVGFEVINIAW